MKKILIYSLLCFSCSVVWAKVYQSIQDPSKFIASCFNNDAPTPNRLWVKGEIKKNIESILQHQFSKLRVCYWKKGDLSVWILDEIGKEAPITFGIAVEKSKIKEAKVLLYRESRGGEITRASFRNQFYQSSINDKLKLNTNIDGISGATLSVRAMTKVVRIALYLDSQIKN